MNGATDSLDPSESKGYELKKQRSRQAGFDL